METLFVAHFPVIVYCRYHAAYLSSVPTNDAVLSHPLLSPRYARSDDLPPLLVVVAPEVVSKTGPTHHVVTISSCSLLDAGSEHSGHQGFYGTRLPHSVCFHFHYQNPDQNRHLYTLMQARMSAARPSRTSDGSRAVAPKFIGVTYPDMYHGWTHLPDVALEVRRTGYTVP
jgi:hypothetical protein